jgi:hypothetical protein
LYTSTHRRVTAGRDGRLQQQKLTFFKPASAQEFLARYHQRGFVVGRRAARAVHNRIKVPEATEGEEVTRVLVIEGPREVVNEGVLERYFRANFEYQTRWTRDYQMGGRGREMFGVALRLVPSAGSGRRSVYSGEP